LTRIFFSFFDIFWIDHEFTTYLQRPKAKAFIVSRLRWRPNWCFKVQKEDTSKYIYRSQENIGSKSWQSCAGFVELTAPTLQLTIVIQIWSYPSFKVFKGVTTWPLLRFYIKNLKTGESLRGAGMFFIIVDFGATDTLLDSELCVWTARKVTKAKFWGGTHRISSIYPKS